MFPFLLQQANSVGALNLQSFANVARRYMTGVQQIAELNMLRIPREGDH